MTFEEWWDTNKQTVSDMSRKNAAKAAWEAGFVTGQFVQHAEDLASE
jgi:hypothetical protein